ncbi:MAG: hypothetical protein WBB34_18960 [Xanthobacteraceae bacterium]
MIVLTNAKTAAASQDDARKLGLGKFYDAAKAATSMVAVIDPKDGRVIATLYNDGIIGDYDAAINEALKAVHSS